MNNMQPEIGRSLYLFGYTAGVLHRESPDSASELAKLAQDSVYEESDASVSAVATNLASFSYPPLPKYPHYALIAYTCHRLPHEEDTVHTNESLAYKLIRESLRTLKSKLRERDVEHKSWELHLMPMALN